MSPSPASLPIIDSLRLELIAIFDSARRVDVRTFEELSTLDLLERLKPLATTFVEQARSLASRILAHYEPETPAKAEPEAEAPVNFDLAVDALLATASPGSKVADLAFLALTELRQRRARLDAHGPSSDPWELVCDGASAIRRVQKSLGALELAICEAENLPRQLEFESEVRTAIEIRRQYRKFWAFVASVGEQHQEIRPVLRGAGTLLAMLVGRDIYCRLREADRFQLRRLQRRILDWLENSTSDERAGVRLWQDFAGLVSVLRGVNLRQELVEHDQVALDLVARALQGGGPSPGTMRLFDELRGLDDALDAALELRRDDGPALLEIVQRLRARRGRP